MEITAISSLVASAPDGKEALISFLGTGISSVSEFFRTLGERLKGVNLDAIADKAQNLRSLGVVSGVLLVLALLFVIRIIRKPTKLVLKLLINTVLGFVLLFVINLFGHRFGIGVELTWVNALVTGVFGIPGLTVLMILRFVNILR